jgi:tetratricopeptide (TPR) repeat protein
MSNARKGKWIRDTYEVLQTFPLHQGTMYFTRMHSGENDTGTATRFLLAVQGVTLPPDLPPETLLQRDEARFVPAEAVFVENETLYWVYRQLPENWLAHRLLPDHRLPEKQIVHLLQQVIHALMQAEQHHEWTLLHAENIFQHKDGQVRFLHGGPSWLSEAPLSPENEGPRVGLLAYSLLTGQRTPIDVSPENLRSFLDEPAVTSAWKPFLRQAWQPASAVSWNDLLASLQKTEQSLVNLSEEKPKIVTQTKKTGITTQPVPLPWWKRKAARWIGIALGIYILLSVAGWGIAEWISDTPTTTVDPYQAKQAADWYDQSQTAYQDKQYDRALDLGKKALAADPSKEKYYLHLAKLYQLRQDYKNGVQIMKQAVKRFPENPAIQDGLAMQAYYAKDYATAKAASEKAVHLNPSRSSYYHHEAKILSAQGKYTDAVELMKKAISLDKNQSYYYYDLSIYQYRLGQIDEAVKSAKTAISMDRQNVRYQTMLAILYLKERDLVNEDPSLLAEERTAQKQKWAQEAAKIFSPLLKKHVLHASEYYYASVAFYYTGQLPQALEAIQLALKTDNRQALYHYQYGVVLASSGKRNEAIAEFQQATRLDANNPLYKQALTQFQKK